MPKIYIDEIWKDVKIYEGLYQVSNLGRVKSLRRRDSLDRYWIRERILKSVQDIKGYFSVILCKNNSVEKFLVHRLVALAFISNPENKPEVNHKNGIKSFNEVTNLEWVTHQENIQHSFDKLRRIGPRGETHGNSKLTQIDILQIKDSSLQQKELALIFNVNQSQISRIKSGKRWGGVLCPV